MGTEVLIPYDVLSNQRLGFDASPAAAALFPHRKRATGGGSSANPRPRRKPDQRKRREPAVAAAAPLRRGGSLDSKVGGRKRRSRNPLVGGRRRSDGLRHGEAGPGARRRSEADPPGGHGGAPAARGNLRRAGVLGVAVARALPLPTFPSKKPDAATRDLRRLLRLDQ
ncbi:unnamed protein product [Spirodela intermedia]|uniref:Uncharacterized protein n=1 Tax=Spirodela intermedia TaxID=51605 RepID=A0A7I8JH14_SPIIN|nr:unnamed protein product [Spirodela intermedia]CAA6669045.1 unnamed protein product [Spirodela intermedia]